jgi:putative PIN family toxin of toxin-antitoxin system
MGRLQRGEPLDKERSNNLLKSLLLYSLLCNAARRVCVASPMSTEPAPQTPGVYPALLDAPVVVLDTNVVLDCLLFDDQACHALAAQLRTRHLAWCTTASMRAELLSVLPRPQFLAWNPSCENILSTFDQWSIMVPVDASALQPAALLCRDPADQKFIDLAYACNARWLFSRDRALLDLAKPARTGGLEILTPASWQRRYLTFEPDDAAESNA